MGKVVHVIPHSHWDREWYLPFEKHRGYLLQLINDCMDLFEKDPEYRCFFLDGQTIVIDDYLEIYPENREKILKYIREGRFVIGPWYILQDEFLTGGEANVRNLLTGLRKSREFLSTDACIPEGMSKVGYFPDAFGNASQMPQLMKQAHMDAIVFGRGVRPIGFNNEVMENKGEFDSVYSEMMWESPDGSKLPAVLFANWYNNGVEIPTEEDKAEQYWNKKISDAAAYASTDHLLLMNGCDHQPVQKDLSEALRTARKLYPDTEFRHSNMSEYISEVMNSHKELSTVTGELMSQETNGLMTLAHTASTHADMKLENRACENYLAKIAEPLAVQAMIAGGTYPQSRLQFSWMELMKNHPHDSICSCSADEVLDQMKERFAVCRQSAESVTAKQLEYLADRIAAGVKEQEQISFAVFSYDGCEKKQVISTVLDWDRCWDMDLNAGWHKMNDLTLPEFILTDETGEEVAAVIRDKGVSFGYTLPNDRFRQPYMARQIEVVFEAELPAAGYRTYLVKEKKADTGLKQNSILAGPMTMENAFIKVEVLENGSYSILNKDNGHVTSGIGFFEDTGDIGNEYEFVQSSDHRTYDTKGLKPVIEVEEDNSVRAVIRIEYEWELPESAAQQLDDERAQFVNIYMRKAGRSENRKVVRIVNRLILEAHAEGLKVQTTVNNTVKDHRLRVCFPTGIKAEEHYADSLFAVSRRANTPGRNWINPSNSQRQQAFTALEDSENGLLIANKGLYEYEIEDPDRSVIAVTLLRCTGEIGDWGVFPTPSAQMQGEYTFEYEVIPYAAGKKEQAFTRGYQFQNPVAVRQLPTGCVKKYGTEERKAYDPAVSLSEQLIEWDGAGLVLTGIKKCDMDNAVAIRWVNVHDSEKKLTVRKAAWMRECFFSNIVEEKIREIQADEDRYTCSVKPEEIITICFTVR